MVGPTRPADIEETRGVKRYGEVFLDLRLDRQGMARAVLDIDEEDVRTAGGEFAVDRVDDPPALAEACELLPAEVVEIEAAVPRVVIRVAVEQEPAAKPRSGVGPIGGLCAVTRLAPVYGGWPPGVSERRPSRVVRDIASTRRRSRRLSPSPAARPTSWGWRMRPRSSGRRPGARCFGAGSRRASDFLSTSGSLCNQSFSDRSKASESHAKTPRRKTNSAKNSSVGNPGAFNLLFPKLPD